MGGARVSGAARAAGGDLPRRCPELARGAGRAPARGVPCYLPDPEDQRAGVRAVGRRAGLTPRGAALGFGADPAPGPVAAAARASRRLRSGPVLLARLVP